MNASTVFWHHSQPLILASRSTIRAQLFQDAGLPVEIVPADVDEREIEKPLMEAGALPEEVARMLATEKARAVSEKFRDRIVVGADQTLAFQDERLTKSSTWDEARATLEKLSGQTHSLFSAAAVALNGEIETVVSAAAHLHMRPLSAHFIDRYIESMGDAVFTTVGAYQLEGLGVQLFERVEGDYFTVLGLPLLPLLDHFRRMGYLFT